MSEIQTPVSSVTGTLGAVAPQAGRMTAIQIIEQEIVGFIKQREQAVANVHAVEGAIQAAQFLLAKLKAEAAKAEAEVKAVAAKAYAVGEGLVKQADAAVDAAVSAVETEATKVVNVIEKAL